MHHRSATLERYLSDKGAATPTVQNHAGAYPVTITAEITIGTRVHCVLSYCGEGIVCGIKGEQNPASCKVTGGVLHSGGAAHFDVVFLNGSQSPACPEAVIRGVQWRILPGLADAEQIAAALANVACVKAMRANAASNAKAAFAAAVDELRARAELAKLEQGDDTSSGTLAAKNIRAQLRAAFPRVKFSVRKRHYGAVSISWTDGPTAAAVDAITNNYKAGRFNGSEDIYESSRSPWTTVFGGAEYVSTSRDHSPAHITRAIAALFNARDLDGIEQPTAEDYASGKASRVRVPGEQWDLGVLIRSAAIDMEAGA